MRNTAACGCPTFSGLVRSSEGQLELGGVNLAALAGILGTPLYVLDEEAVRARCRRYIKAFAHHFTTYDIAYAAKALCNKAVITIMMQEGMSLDVVSGGELYTALAAGFPPGRIYFNGNNKSEEEMLMAVRAGVGRFVVDNVDEFLALECLARRRRTEVNVLLRVRPGIEAHCHHYVQTGSEDSKFGMSPDEATALISRRRRKQGFSGWVRVRGIHCHVGSQILELEPFRLAAARMMELLARMKKSSTSGAHSLDEVSLGGGLGVGTVDGDVPPSVEEYAGCLAETIRAVWENHGLGELPRVIVEPGRSIVSEAGVTLYTVGATKRCGGIRYAFIDGGMGDNPRPMLYGARYSCLLANREGHGEQTYRIGGRYCESGDVLIDGVRLPNLKRGDILAVPGTGAYNYSMASNYNRVPRPAMALVGWGRWDVIVERESYEHVASLDVVPARLARMRTASENDALPLAQGEPPTARLGQLD